MFMAYPAIVQLVRSPMPLGFGGDAVDAANIPTTFHDYVPSLCERDPAYHKSNRKVNANHNRFRNKPNWVTWTVGVSLNIVCSIY